MGLSVWGTCPFYLLRFEAKTCNLLHFGARIFHAHFLIKIFYSYHRFLHVHWLANYVHWFLHGNSLSFSMVLIDLYTVFTSCSTVIIDFFHGSQFSLIVPCFSLIFHGVQCFFSVRTWLFRSIIRPMICLLHWCRVKAHI